MQNHVRPWKWGSDRIRRNPRDDRPRPPINPPISQNNAIRPPFVGTYPRAPQQQINPWIDNINPGNSNHMTTDHGNQNHRNSIHANPNPGNVNFGITSPVNPNFCNPNSNTVNHNVNNRNFSAPIPGTQIRGNARVPLLPTPKPPLQQQGNVYNSAAFQEEMDFDNADRKCNFNSGNLTFNTGNPNFNSRNSNFNTGHCSFNTGHSSFNNGHPNFTTRNPDFKTEIPDFKPEIPDFDNRNPDFNTETPDLNNDEDYYPVQDFNNYNHENNLNQLNFTVKSNSSNPIDRSPQRHRSYQSNNWQSQYPQHPLAGHNEIPKEEEEDNAMERPYKGELPDVMESSGVMPEGISEQENQPNSLIDDQNNELGMVKSTHLKVRIKQPGQPGICRRPRVRGRDEHFAGVPRERVRCYICSLKLTGSVDYKNHMKGRSHKEALQKRKEKYEREFSELKLEAQKTERQKVWQLKELGDVGVTFPKRFCAVCTVNVVGDFKIHQNTDYHKNLIPYHELECQPCKSTFPTRIDFDIHLSSIGHIKVVGLKEAEERLAEKKAAQEAARALKEAAEKVGVSKTAKPNEETDEKYIHREQGTSDTIAEPTKRETRSCKEEQDEAQKTRESQYETPKLVKVKEEISSGNITKVENLPNNEKDRDISPIKGSGEKKDSSTSMTPAGVEVLPLRRISELQPNDEPVGNTSQYPPTYDPEVEFGKDAVTEIKGFLCNSCKVFLITSEMVSPHLKSEKHFRQHLAKINKPRGLQSLSRSLNKRNEESPRASTETIETNNEISRVSTESNEGNEAIRRTSVESNEGNKEIRRTSLESNVNEETPRTSTKSNKANKEIRRTSMESKEGNKKIPRTSTESSKANKEIPRTSTESNKGYKGLPRTSTESNEGYKGIPRTSTESNKGNKEISRTSTESNKGNKEISRTSTESSEGNEEIPDTSTEELSERNDDFSPSSTDLCNRHERSAQTSTLLKKRPKRAMPRLIKLRKLQPEEPPLAPKTKTKQKKVLKRKQPVGALTSNAARFSPTTSVESDENDSDAPNDADKFSRINSKVMEILEEDDDSSDEEGNWKRQKTKKSCILKPKSSEDALWDEVTEDIDMLLSVVGNDDENYLSS